MNFQRIGNLLELFSSEIVKNKEYLHEKTGTLKASVLTSVQRALEADDYCAVSQPPALNELREYELCATVLRDLSRHVQDMHEIVSHLSYSSAVAAATTATGTAHTTDANGAEVTSGQVSGVSSVRGAPQQKRRQVVTLSAAHRGDIDHRLVGDAGPNLDLSATLIRSKTDILREALNSYLSPEEFRLVDWKEFRNISGLSPKFSSAVTAQLAAKGELLCTKVGMRTAYALAKPVQRGALEQAGR